MNFWEFYKNFDKALYLNKNRSDVEFKFLLNNLHGCSTVIDYGCGSGRLAIPLSEKGFKVLGIDSDNDEISLAEQNSNNKNTEFICTNYLNYYSPTKYDAAIFIYSSFGYGNDRENVKLLQNVNKNLSLGGILILDLLNKEWSRKTQGIKDMSEKMDLSKTDFKELIRERKLFDNDNYEKTTFRYVLRDGVKRSISFKQKLYTYNEITMKLVYSEFKVIQGWGSYDGTDYNQPDSKRLIIKAIKS
ncbi:class I SAM-dependent methyltransferase [Candidatus Dojkabacteria bacterium]|uniref:Class I SAM-dependent methyltransferase n=1 Tax=Candidatus Dojkabacteria bacterium TaxID=2099670 RepID=A0A955LBX2_9BACT|nr:class I SAM-dependent methyltransferase [Candidatus Dojkabacteria bacterium]